MSVFSLKSKVVRLNSIFTKNNRSAMEDITRRDLYELFGVDDTASIQDIKKAYRKKALTCHPDKDQDNPRAAEIFKELVKALQILTDVDARAAYDKVIAARKQANERIKTFDNKRKKFKEDLEAREEAHRRSLDHSYNINRDEERLKAEIERLQKEGSKQVEEEIAFVQKQIWEQLHGLSKSTEFPDVKEFRIKIRWKVQEGDQSNGGYNYDNLYRMFSKYGDVVALVFSKKTGKAMIEFGDKSAAEMALLTEIGLVENPLMLCGLWNVQKHSSSVASGTNFNVEKPIFPMDKHTSSKPCSSVSFPSAPDIFQKRMSDAEFENSVLANLRKAEERKRLIEELKTQEET